MGKKMNTLLAWFITFNFINITWIFFRSKDWSHASNILYGMIGDHGIILHERLASKLAFLNSYGIEFGNPVQHIGGSFFQTSLTIITFFVVAIFFKNSNYYKDHLVLNWKMALLGASLFSFAFIKSLVTSTEVFLYYNF